MILIIIILQFLKKWKKGAIRIMGSTLMSHKYIWKLTNMNVRIVYVINVVEISKLVHSVSFYIIQHSICMTVFPNHSYLTNKYNSIVDMHNKSL